MTTTAQQIIDSCNSVVNDDGTKWEDDDWLSFIHAGEVIIADNIPAAVSTIVSTRLVPGALQQCPAGAGRFLALTCNNGSDGNTSGAVICLCDEAALSAFLPGWMGSTASITVENYIFDENDPTRFFVYPPVHASTPVYVGLKYAQTPARCASASVAVTVADSYAPALIEWCLACALGAETDSADPNRAAGHLNNFYNMVGLSGKARVMSSPNVHNRAGIPPREVAK